MKLLQVMLLICGEDEVDDAITLEVQGASDVSVKLVGATFGLELDEDIFIRGDTGVVLYPTALDETGTFYFPDVEQNWVVYGNTLADTSQNSDSSSHVTSGNRKSNKCG